MSFADPSSLITNQLVDSSMQVDARLKRMLATSLVVHAVLLVSLMSVRFAPPLQQPLASYHVDLITLPEPRSTPSVQQPSRVKKVKVPPPPKPKTESRPTPAVAKSPPPVDKATPAPAPVVEPIQTEKVTPSIMEAMKGVALPQNRKLTSIEPSSTVPQPPVESARNEVEHPNIALPVVPQAPQLAKRQTLGAPGSSSSSTPASSSMAESLQQAVRSVAVPQRPKAEKSSASSQATPTQKMTPSKPSEATPSTPGIRTPGQAPQLAKVVPATEPTEVSPPAQSRTRVADSLKQVIQSVVVPEVKKSKPLQSKETPAVLVPVPRAQDTKPKPRKKLQGMVMPSEAPQLAKVDVSQVQKALQKKPAHPSSLSEEASELEQKIAKLVIPEFQVSEPHHIESKPTDAGVQKTMTTLHVAGSSPDGNAYWGRVWSKIDREWIAPTVTVRSDQPIRVILAFRIERNGAVKNLGIEQSSGNEYYDLAAKRAVMDAAPLPPFASDMPERYHDVQFQFTVNLDS